MGVGDIIPHLRRLRIQHLRFLALLAQLGSLTACAKALHLSQPAVSNLLKDLEAAFGATLVERDARGGRLTPAGARVLTRVTHSLAGCRLARGWLGRHTAHGSGGCWRRRQREPGNLTVAPSSAVQRYSTAGSVRELPLAHPLLSVQNSSSDAPLNHLQTWWLAAAHLQSLRVSAFWREQNFFNNL